MQKIAFLIIGIGALIGAGYYVYWFFSSDIDLLFRLGVGAVVVGVLILLGVVIQQRIKASKDEDFKGVKY
ncbi:MAG: hypothetical protein SVY53_11260 [Chloroflexota bacterium]|nr:hypothetical protein [Chloroflexota bacterium]